MLKKLWGELHQSYFVVVFAVGVVAGVVVGFICRINFMASPVWITLAVVLMVIAYLKPKYAFIVIALIAGMIVAFSRVSAELIGENYIRKLTEQTVVVVGDVIVDPNVDDEQMKIKLGHLRFGEDEEYEISGTLYVSLGQNEEIMWGDTVKLSGEMSDGLGTFAGYMYRPKMVAVERPEPGNLVLRVRNYFANRIRSLIPEPEVNLGLSYLLGMKNGLPDELAEALKVVGLSHIVVASGAHLSILVGIARKIFGKISRFIGLLFSMVFIVVFMAMVGWTPSILRAGIMSILSLIAWYVGRKIAPIRLILIVAASTLLMNPSFVIDLGWLLSFASFAGIMILGPKMTNFFYGTKKPGAIGSMVLVTLAATMITLPITLYYYGTISLISVIANLLILPTLPYAMGFVFVMGVTAGIPGVEMVISWCATQLLDFHIAVVNFFGQMTQFLVRITPYQPWVFILYLPVFAMLLIGLLRRKMVKLREAK